MMEKLSSERVKSLLAQKGTEVTLEEAEKVLIFLRKMSNIVVSSYLDKKLEERNSKKYNVM